MDLHNYKDVAENYDRYLEVMFSEFDAHEGFQNFYLELAKKYGGGGVVEFVEYDSEGNVIGERIRPLLMRQTYRSEVFLLAELCGYEVLDIYRGYKGDKEDLNDPSSAARYQSNLIWILKK